MRKAMLMIPIIMILLFASLAYTLEEKTVLFDRPEKIQVFEGCAVIDGAVRLVKNATEGYLSQTICLMT